MCIESLIDYMEYSKYGIKMLFFCQQKSNTKPMVIHGIYMVIGSILTALNHFNHEFLILD